MEDLRKLRKEDLESEYRRLMWIPSKFYELLEYKAKEQGIELVRVNPRNTSRRCSVCGHTSKENRPSQAKFICVKCGAEMNADYNGAKNIAMASGEVIEQGY
jgi:transposase